MYSQCLMVDDDGDGGDNEDDFHDGDEDEKRVCQ